VKSEIVVLALVVGAGTWALRYLPLRSRASRRRLRQRATSGDGGSAQSAVTGSNAAVIVVGRFLEATGVAAVAALTAAALLPYVRALTGAGGGEAPTQLDQLVTLGVPLLVGILATVAAFLPRRSVGAGTVIGAAAYGLSLWLLGGA